MKLTHYASKPFSLEKISYQLDTPTYISKPHGLWVSDDHCEYNWKWWCINENFRRYALRYAHAVEFTNDANILKITSWLGMEQFNHKYKKCYDIIQPILQNQQPMELNGIDWQKVKDSYDGIIISPYNWDKRLDRDYMWYYGWDCASGCIWNLEAIKSFAVKNKSYTRRDIYKALIADGFNDNSGKDLRYRYSKGEYSILERTRGHKTNVFYYFTQIRGNYIRTFKYPENELCYYHKRPRHDKFLVLKMHIKDFHQYSNCYKKISPDLGWE